MIDEACGSYVTDEASGTHVTDETSSALICVFNCLSFSIVIKHSLIALSIGCDKDPFSADTLGAGIGNVCGGCGHAGGCNLRVDPVPSFRGGIRGGGSSGGLNAGIDALRFWSSTAGFGRTSSDRDRPAMLLVATPNDSALFALVGLMTTAGGSDKAQQGANPSAASSSLSSLCHGGGGGNRCDNEGRAGRDRLRMLTAPSAVTSASPSCLEEGPSATVSR
jgi:hypothetical protein